MEIIKRYEILKKVEESDIDELNHVNNVRYLQWVQEIATEHWCDVIEKHLSKEYIWVVKSHFIEYKRPSYLGETLKIVTYIKNYKGYISTRIVEIYNAETNRLNVKTATDWCLYNSETKKPMRIPDEILSLNIADE